MKCAYLLTLLSIATATAWVMPPSSYGPSPTAGQSHAGGPVQAYPSALSHGYPGATGQLLPTPPPPPTLSLDLEELALLVPMVPLQQLAIRYLLNDAQFQAFTRIINSQDAFIARMRVKSQPEVIAFTSWVRLQLMLSGGSFEMESEEVLSLINPTPYWANTVYGWQGFITEFLAYYPMDMIKAHINAKVMQNGIFAQFWARLKALKPVYERALLFPETQRVIAQLEAAGIDTQQLDQLIRHQFDWVNLPAVAPTAVGQAPGAPATDLAAAAPAPVDAAPVPVDAAPAPVDHAAPASGAHQPAVVA